MLAFALCFLSYVVFLPFPFNPLFVPVKRGVKDSEKKESFERHCHLILKAAPVLPSSTFLSEDNSGHM